MVAVLSRYNQPLLQVGNLAFDCEVSVTRGGEREVSERRLAAGASVAEHSRRPPRVFEVSGAVSVLAQPQNIGRPGAPSADATFEQIETNLNEAIIPLEMTTRLQDFETRLDALLDDEVFGELELVSKVVGRVSCVLVAWRATTSPEDGRSATYSLTLREVQRAGLTIALATPDALALNGSGGGPSPGGGGPSQSTPTLLDVIP